MSRGQATVEFAILLPLVVVCAGFLVGVVSVCLSLLQLNDFVRVAARSVATTPLDETTHRSFETSCTCTLTVSTTSDIITVRAKRPIAVPLIGITVPTFHIHAKSIAMKEPAVIFEAPSP